MLYIGAQALLEDAFELGARVLESGFRPSFIVAIWRGGAPIGIAVQELLDYFGVESDHIAIRTSSYSGIDGQASEVRVHGLNYLLKNIERDDRLLIVDDVFDTGRTIEAVIYTVSPVHTDAYYTGKIREMVALGVDGVFLKDPSGLLTPERAATLVPAAKRACGSLPLQIHSHCLSGLAPYVVVKCVEHGANAVHTATSTLADGASHPSTEQFVRNARRAGFDVDVDLAVVEDVADRLQFIAANEGKPVGEIAPYDEFHYHHQVPGGMISNLKSQLAPLGIEHRLEEILDEAGRVRADLGYPIVVSPFAQFIITQSVLNVMNEERYASVPDEVRKYVLGYYGEIAGPIDANLFDRITGGAEPVADRPGRLAPPALDRLRSARGPFASDDDLLLAAYYDEREYGALKAAGSIETEYPIGETPLLSLVKALVQRPNLSSVRLTGRG